MPPAFKVAYLDHVNIRTARLAEMTGFYRDILGLAPGPRPPFSFGGAWLYCGERPCVHLVDVEPDEGEAPDPSSAGELRLSHFAFAASGLAELVGRLRARGVPHRLSRVPGTGVQQVAFQDVDGNDLHVDFAPDEPA